MNIGDIIFLLSFTLIIFIWSLRRDVIAKRKEKAIRENNERLLEERNTLIFEYCKLAKQCGLTESEINAVITFTRNKEGK